MDTSDGVTKLVPVPKLAPPEAAAYQLIVPADAVAPRVTVPLTQTPPDVVLVMVGIVFIVAITAVRLAVVQPPLVASA